MPRRPFVGRGQELAALEQAARRARGGRPGVALVFGEPGIGKSALIERFMATLDGHAHVRRASSDDAERFVPFGVLGQLFPAFDGAWGPMNDIASVGARLLGYLGGVGRGPTVIVVDDAQWADEPSLTALQFALRRLDADDVLAVFVARELGAELDGIRRLADRATGGVVEVPGLSVTELEELSEALGVENLPKPALLRLHDHTGGNPLHATAVLNEVGVEALANDAAPLPAPRSFRLHVLGRLSAYPPDTRDLVGAAAVLGHRCRLDMAGDLAGLDHPLEAFQGAVDADILVAEPGVGPLVVRFRHPLVRAAVYDDLPPSRRCTLHAAAAAVLGPDTDPGLDHRARASVGSDEGLAADLTAAAEHQRGAAPTAAAHQLLTAARFSADPAAGRQRRLAAVECLLAAGDIRRAEAALAELDDHSAEVLLLAGHAAFILGRHARARQLLDRAWARCDATATPALAGRIAARFVDMDAFSLRPLEAADWARVALDLAPEAVSLPPAATTMALSGSRYEAVARFERTAATRPLGEQIAGDAVLEAWAGELGPAWEMARRAADVLRDAGAVWARISTLHLLASVEYRLGRWDDMLLHAGLAASIFDDIGSPEMGVMHRALSAIVHAERGDAETADDYLRQAAAGARGEVAMQTGWLAAARARAAQASGDPAATIAAVEATLPRLSGCRPMAIAEWVTPYVEALTAAGRLDDAETHLAPYEAWLELGEPAPLRADAWRVRGQLAAARRDVDGAIGAFAAGYEHADRIGAIFDRAHIELAWGALLRRRGLRRDAARRLEAARTQFEALGARPFRARCERELAACGLTPAARRRRRRTDLTPAELNVARLVASGRTNREVAAELVVSPKTVEFHLASVFRKLGITARDELAERTGDLAVTA